MISLRDLLIEDDDRRDTVNQSHPPHSVWQTKSLQWGATDDWGIVRYYNTREEAWAYANNQGKESPHPGRPEPKKIPKRRKEKQTDDRADRD